MNNTINKILACMLVIVLTCTNLVLLGTYATHSYAGTSELEMQKTLIKDKVEFDAYFLNGKEKVHSKLADVNQTDLKLYVSINVKEGYLSNASINIQDANFVLEDISQNYEEVQKIENNIITLNQISKDKEIVLEIPIKVKKADMVNVNNFSKENSAKITGTLVTGETGITGQEKNTEIENTIKVKLDIYGEATPILNKGATTYTEYQIEGETGVILQTIVQTGLENNNLPIKVTTLELDVPVLNEIKPYEISVRANSLMGTKASNTYTSFTKVDENIIDGTFIYNQTDSKITIKSENIPNEQNEIVWAKGLDEYIITYVYKNQTISEITEMALRANLEIQTYAFNSEDNNQTIQTVSKLDEEIKTLQKTTGNIVTSEIEATDILSKGYFYHKPEIETEYQVKWNTKIGYAEIIDDIELQNVEADLLKSEDESTVISGATYYKTTIISKDIFTNLLVNEQTTGNAYIEIWNSNGNSNEPIARIDETTQTDEQNNFVVNYDDGVDNIYIIISHPVKTGELEITHNKAIKVDSIVDKYSTEQLKTLTKLETKLSGSAINNNVVLDGNETSEKSIMLQDPQTQISASIDNSNLSTVVTNENVNLKLVLESNDITKDLYKEPVIEMVLPSYIEKMVINKIDLLHEEELGEPVVTPTTNEAGNSVLIISMPGEQTGYHSDKTTEGATIAINADITVKRLTPSITDKIQIYVTNKKAVSYENSVNGKGYLELPVNFVAPIGMVTVNSISRYNGEESVLSVSGQEALGKLKINSPATIAKVNLTVINNYEDTCENVSILGRLPFQGNKHITTGEELGSNMTLSLASGITAISGINAENIEVYYSENGEATRDLNNVENGWNANLDNLLNVKSYLIVLKDYQMSKGSVVEFAYDIQIPENLKHDQTAYTMYTVYFDKDSQGQEANTSSKVGLSTMPGPSLEVNLKANVENGQTVQEGDRITYTVDIKNTGNIDAEKVNVSSVIPEGAVYLEYIPEDTNGYGPEEYIEHPEIAVVESVVDVIKPGETKTIQYMVLVKSIGEEEKTISSVANILVEDSGDVYTTNTIQNIAKKGLFIIELNSVEERLSDNEEFAYEVLVRNTNNETKTNVVVTNKIPDGLTYVNVEVYKNSIDDVKNISYNQENNTLTYNLSELKENDKIEMYIIVKANALSDSELEKEIVNQVKGTCDQVQYEILSNEVKVRIQKPKLEIKQQCDVAPGDINVGDEITYNIEVKNIGLGMAYNVEVTDYIPEGLNHLKTEYKIGDYSSTTSAGIDKSKVYTDIPAGETLYIKVKVIAKELEEGISQKEVTNIVKVVANSVEEIEANKITHIINSNRNIGQDDEDGTVEDNYNNTYKITGTVWKDNNENGNREDEENIFEGITVILINPTTASKVSETLTDANGKYEFTNIEKGRYIVAFIYNTQEYMVTTYQEEGVNESRNSDAIDNTIIVDNSQITGAVTNNINLTSSNVYNIDLGLVLRNKFDLSLSKSINSIIVTTTRGTETYNYDEGEDLAKIDIAPKRIEGANVVIEYKITVQNNGNVAGTVSKVVDYLPEELKFSSKLNPEWYEAEDGNIYSIALADTLIQPGESRDIILVLTKTMTGENTGLINNRAEIFEAYNDLGLEDINSIPGNKVQNENDMSSADVLITVNTGEPAMYITLSIAMLALFATGAYFINKKVIKK